MTLLEIYVLAAMVAHAIAIAASLSLPWRIRRALASEAWDAEIQGMLGRVLDRSLGNAARAAWDWLHQPKEDKP